ncbi:hypothetical protein THASP1DRAFT_28849 [Thamnocephalis sphaerospora]|uniref:Uncharacterized protein n=1 Tax=Thamnocephalis sphaerospora TaxID=78915 RepID=A0A4V1IX02_9FUNG|nr:hypothetical protein THASP1DRAFT_28849 [Thamnocephalis sphaerospora]|eukprot:RKP09349.1 hypothetical protein THASP1DRAFT_28849 [Thamnocephalis sphaerospora]
MPCNLDVVTDNEAKRDYIQPHEAKALSAAIAPPHYYRQPQRPSAVDTPGASNSPVKPTHLPLPSHCDPVNHRSTDAAHALTTRRRSRSQTALRSRAVWRPDSFLASPTTPVGMTLPVQGGAEFCDVFYASELETSPVSTQRRHSQSNGHCAHGSLSLLAVSTPPVLSSEAAAASFARRVQRVATAPSATTVDAQHCTADDASAPEIKETSNEKRSLAERSVLRVASTPEFRKADRIQKRSLACTINALPKSLSEASMSGSQRLPDDYQPVETDANPRAPRPPSYQSNTAERSLAPPVQPDYSSTESSPLITFVLPPSHATRDLGRRSRSCATLRRQPPTVVVTQHSMDDSGCHSMLSTLDSRELTALCGVSVKDALPSPPIGASPLGSVSVTL